MPEYVERLTRCGVNLADALDIYDEFMAEGNESGLSFYVLAVEDEYNRREGIA